MEQSPELSQATGECISDPIPFPSTQSSVTCRACSSAGAVDVFEAGDLPLNVGEFYETAEEAIAAPKGRVTLAFCPSCGFVFNRHFDPDVKVFEPGYEVALHHSPTFRKFLEGVAQRLVTKFGLKEKRIVEIGCGDAYFLKRLAELGGNDCVGIDPTIVKAGEQDVSSGSVRLIRDYFGSEYQDIPADFVCCLSVFEDIPHPAPFLAAAHAMAARAGAPLYFEVFNAWRAFEASEVWSVHYEQCNYFSLDSLQSVFTRNGFSIDAAATCYEGDQYLFVEARPKIGAAPGNGLCANMPVPETLLAFEKSFEERRAYWNDFLAACRDRGERVVVWGTGGKGITFLNSLDDSEFIEFVVEINPDKQGKFVPGTGQKIVPPEFLAEYQPQNIIITNALYEREMKAQAQEMGVRAKFLIA